MVENSFDKSPLTFGRHIGKIGLVIMMVGLFIVYFDAYVLIQMFPTDYKFYNHPQIYVPIIGTLIAFGGTSIFIYNFIKGKKVI